MRHMNGFDWTAMLGLLLPILVGVLTRYTMAGLKKVSPLVDGLPAWAKQTVVVAIAAVLTGIATITGVDLCGGAVCETADNVTSGGLGAVIAAIFAMVTHNGKKIASPPSVRLDARR